MSKTRFDKKGVFPGEKLAVIEEFSDGEGTYEADGQVRSAELGDVKLNQRERTVEVDKRTRELNLPLEGTGSLEELTGASVVSRLIGMCRGGVFELKGADARRREKRP
jgi:exosome complex RNA-binding protein Csl4